MQMYLENISSIQLGRDLYFLNQKYISEGPSLLLKHDKKQQKNSRKYICCLENVTHLLSLNAKF